MKESIKAEADLVRNEFASLTPEQAEIARLRDHMVRLEHQLADVYASKSWTVTYGKL